MTIDEVIAGVPEWAGQRVDVEPIEGGLTNQNYRLTVEGSRYCVRIPGAGSSLLAIDRKIEYHDTLAAAETGVGAAVVHAVGDVPVMVLEWIEGTPQTDVLLRESPDGIRKLAEATRLLHAGRPFVRVFEMFGIQRGYLRICREREIAIPDTYDDYEPVVRRIEQAVAVRGHDLVPCNNDLLAANLIDEGERFRIIDYEYSGMNDPCFELGNAAAESKFAEEQVEELIARYFGRPLRNRVARAQLWALMANYGWTLWACIQQAVSDIDFDFWAWGVDDKYARAVEAFEGPDLGRWLEDVTRGD
jgi:thiamine kinase-like enzyme